MLELRTPLVLASRSPRRKRLLEQIGLAFTVVPSGVEEALSPDLSPGDAAARVALDKAAAVAAGRRPSVTLGADTIVVLDGAVLGKPVDEAEAAAMLSRLSGRTHTVYTGLALVHPDSDRNVCTYEQTDVSFATLSDHEIEAYVSTGSPLDKAGAYGIQDDLGALFVSRVDGDYYNVVGLPLHRLYRLLREHFADLLASPGVAAG